MVAAITPRKLDAVQRRHTHLTLAAVCALAIWGNWVAVATASESVVALPTVHVVTKAIHFQHKRALLVQSILVGNIEGMDIQVSCDHCRRYRTRIQETHPTASSKRFNGVSWIVAVGRDIQVEVRHKGRTGRFLLLGAGAGNTLIFESSGCLTARPVRRVGCPQVVQATPVGTTVPGGNPTISTKPETPALPESKEKFAEIKQTPAEVESTTPTPTPTPTPVPTPTPSPAPTTYSETSGSVIHTWTNYSDAGGSEGPEVPSNDTVQIACKVSGFKVADGNTWWYRIASSPWNDSYYGSADAFYNNGQTSGSLKGTPFDDPNVPNC